MREPDLLIGELLSVDTLSSGAIMIGEVTALSHESFDNSVENALLVAIVVAFFHCTKLSEVLCSLRDFLGKDFEHNSALLFLFFRSVRVTDLNIHESLNILSIIFRKLVEVLGRLGSFLFVIKTLRKQSLHLVCLSLCLILLLLLDSLKQLPEILIIRCQLDSILYVIHGRLQLLHLFVGLRSYVQGLHCLAIESEGTRAKINGLFGLVELVEGQGTVLVENDGELGGLLRGLPDLLDVLDAIHVDLHGLLVLSFLEMAISFILVPLCKFQKIWITFFASLAILDLHQFHFEDKSGPSRNLGWTS